MWVSSSRFNQTGAADCQLGSYFLGSSFEVAYDPGSFLTYWMTTFSGDHCYVMYPGFSNNPMLEEFCQRIGGRIPEIRSQEQLDSITEISGCELLLRKNSFHYTSTVERRSNLSAF